jgi:hypothetical protein
VSGTVEDTAQTAKWIALLSSPESYERAAGAAGIRLAADTLFHAAAIAWMTNREFRALVCPTYSGAGVESDLTVGIAVQPETFERIRAANGAPRLAEVPPDQDAKEFELHFGGGATSIDVLTTREPGGGGAIARFLQKFGEGIQQIEIYVRDVDRATEILRERFKIAPIYPQKHAGADGTRVNFFLATTAGGKKVLIELVEAAGRGR